MTPTFRKKVQGEYNYGSLVCVSYFIMDNTNSTKSEIRQSIRAKRNALSKDYRRQASKQCVDLIKDTQLVKNNQNFGFYLCNDAEIDIHPLINHCLDQNKKCFLPVLNEKHLDFAEYNKSTELQPNIYNIPEPIIDSPTQLIQPQLLDVVFIPLVAFSKSGHRLGMGGGFYDRTFAFLHNSTNNINIPKLIGTAYDIQCVDDLPIQEWDIDLYGVVTETNLIIF